MTRHPKTKKPSAHARAAAAAALVTFGLAAGAAQAEDGTKLGTLTCLGEGGWGAIITSEKLFDCTYEGLEGVYERYTGTIRKYGIDIGKTQKSALAWVVLGSATRIGGDYLPGSLAGDYRGVGAEATVGAGVGANLLFREGDSVFALQPVSVQLQTGLSIAAGVQVLTLEYLGPVAR